MDLIKFEIDAAQDLFLTEATLVSGVESLMWVERYREAGEFELTAGVSSGLKETLPVGCIVSHLDTGELMVVENQEISEDADGQSSIKITGRSLETILEQRVVGANRVWPATAGDPLNIYSIAANPTWVQADWLIEQGLYAPSLTNANDAVSGILARHDLQSPVIGPNESVIRPLKRGDIYKQLLELLEVDNLGLKVSRPGPISPITTAEQDTHIAFTIHNGADKTASVGFAHDSGDLESAEYLWSNKKKKNLALVTGKYLEVLVDDGTVTEGYARRVMFVDGASVDGNYDAMPPVGDRPGLIAKLETLGKQTLAAQNDVAITRAEVAGNNVRYTYRKDFDIGDIVSVIGNYDAQTTMRVVEYVEIEDSSGSRSYPTLSGL